MTYQRLKRYLTFLEQNRLIEYLKEEKLYKATNKGICALQAYNGIQELLID